MIGPQLHPLCRVRVWPLLCILTCILVYAVPSYADSQNRRPAEEKHDIRTSCRGPLTQKIWQIWDVSGHAYVSHLLQSRLLEQGDTYVLYDLQEVLHNLLAMAERCGNVARLRQLATLVQTAFTALESDAPGSLRLNWVCRGGSVCNNVNKLVNTEVSLVSAQFLAFATHAASAMQAHSTLLPEDGSFIRQTAKVAVQHLSRWGDARAVQALRASLGATLQDLQDGSSRYFLTDKEIWFLTIYARLAGITQHDPALAATLQLSPHNWAQLRAHAQALVLLAQRRISNAEYSDSNGSTVLLSDLDVGYWRYHKDNRFASYEGAERPAICEITAGGSKYIRLLLDPSSVPLRDDIGWDLSHARRLVHFLDAITAHREAFSFVWQLIGQQLPSTVVASGFAQQLVAKVWNQDAQRPLFSNYFSGANGWFRVAYENGTGRCREGYPPHGLTDSFVTGGYPGWTAWQPKLGKLAMRLYELVESQDKDDQAFVTLHYRGLSAAASANEQMMQQLMFWPSLISKP